MELEEKIMDKENFNNYSEEELQGVLRFTQSVSNANAELEDAVAQARAYAKARNKERLGRAKEDSPEQLEIDEQVTSWLKRTNRDKKNDSDTRELSTTKPNY